MRAGRLTRLFWLPPCPPPDPPLPALGRLLLLFALGRLALPALAPPRGPTTLLLAAATFVLVARALTPGDDAGREARTLRLLFAWLRFLSLLPPRLLGPSGFLAICCDGFGAGLGAGREAAGCAGIVAPRVTTEGAGFAAGLGLLSGLDEGRFEFGFEEERDAV